MIKDYKIQAPSFLGELVNEWNIGVDIVEISRFQQLSFTSNKQFYKRVFTPEEIKYCLSFKNPTSHFAANFAGKEAIYKAVNMFCDVKLNTIEILRDKNGAPEVNLHLGRKEEKSNITVKVSISHSLSHAVAFAVAHRATKSANSDRKVEALPVHEF